MGADVKFCGLTRAADAAAAAGSGASYLGVIFAESARRLTPAAAREVLDAGMAAVKSGHARRVGVFGALEPREIGRIAAEAGLDIVQLHADPAPADVEAVRAHFRGEIWAALRLDGAELPPHASAVSAASDAIVLDAKAPGVLGGTGRALDWTAISGALASITINSPLVLAGGLTPDNVRLAIEALAPDVVDVSSGVESAPGIKDHAKMRAFAEAAGAVRGRDR